MTPMSSRSTQSRSGAVVDTTHSPHARLRPVPIRAVRIESGFWQPRMKANRDVGLPALFNHLKDHGVIDNFMLASGRKNCERQGPYFTDSDLYKWMEGAAHALASEDLPELRATLESTIDEVLAAQNDDGYLNTFFIGPLSNQRFRNMPVEHELYCAGHYFQACIAHYRATGEERLLKSACRFADYLHGMFGPGKREGKSGHEEIELALVELYRETGEKRYLELAGVLLERLGVRTQETIAGHAVRAMYRCAGAADYFAETGDANFGAVLERLWRDTVHHKMYITGGLGSRYVGEAFGEPYELPNERAYAETCAALGNVFWNWRMLLVTGEARFADVLETALYNGFLAGVALNGSAYFYVNPLACAHDYQRQEWFGCTCCPTNAVRTFASLPGYFYSTSDEGLWVHLYDNSRLDWHLTNGTEVSLVQETRYPWDGRVDLDITVETPTEFTLFLRIPGWCSGASVTVNGKPAAGNAMPASYYAIRRTWSTGDRVRLVLPMSPALQESDFRVRENLGAAAITRGPLVYCLESQDNPGASIMQLEIPASAEFSEEYAPTLLGGVVTIKTKGAERSAPPENAHIYAPIGRNQSLPARPVDVTAIPYYAWANRGVSHMTVWVRTGAGV